MAKNLYLTQGITGKIMNEYHEYAFRGSVLDTLVKKQIFICGAGSLGGNLATFLAPLGVKMTVIDFDRIEIHNRENQPYGVGDVGKLKVSALAEFIYKNWRTVITKHPVRLDKTNVKLLRSADLVIDTFDNAESRMLVQEFCKNNDIDCLHSGLLGGFGSCIWGDYYSITDVKSTGQDSCTYSLAKAAVWFGVAITYELICKYISTGEKNCKTFSLDNLSISDIFKT